MSRKRVVIAGLGDSGILTAIRLAAHYDVVGISVKPGLVSGQELGLRLSRPDHWARDYWISFDRFRALDRVRTLHAELTGVDVTAREVTARRPDGIEVVEPYDALVISTGVANGFWRRPTLQSSNEIGADLRRAHQRLGDADAVIVIGGGAAAVSAAANIATTWPDKRVDLYFPGERMLPSHHARTSRRVGDRLRRAGVGMHPGHRAVLPDGCAPDEITSRPVEFSTGQAPASAQAVVWAIGRVRPNTGWLPAELLDDDGFVRVLPDLRVPHHPGVYAIGDVAATDPLRSSARNRADGLLARNIRADFDGNALREYRPPGDAGGRCSDPSATAWRCSRPTDSRSDFRPGRSTGCYSRGSCGAASTGECDGERSAVLVAKRVVGRHDQFGSGFRMMVGQAQQRRPGAGADADAPIGDAALGQGMAEQHLEVFCQLAHHAEHGDTRRSATQAGVARVSQ